MFFLAGLPSGLRVLVVEKGRVIPWEQQVLNAQQPLDVIRIANKSDKPKAFTAYTLFGGNSNTWWAQTPRFHPSDFQLASLYGVGEDWPLTYDDLEPYYVEVEQAMEVAGEGGEHICPRSAPFPYPAHVLSRTDAALVAHDPTSWVPAAAARGNGGYLAQCCANGICDICPVDAKFRVENSPDLFLREGVSLLTGAEVRVVETAAGRAAGVIVRHADGETRLRASAVALATNGFFNPAILIRSGLGGPATGRYLHEQAGVTLTVDIDHPNWFGGSSITLFGYGAYDGDHRRDSAAVLMENYNAPSFLRAERGRWTERMRLKLVAEDLPQADNRVLLDEAEEPYAEWIGHSEYALRGLERAEAMLPDLMPFTIEGIPERHYPESEDHIQGTHRMGRDPATSVTDPELRLHGVEGLHVLGSGAFPSCSPANPTLTLSALALRAGRHVT